MNKLEVLEERLKHHEEKDNNLEDKIDALAKEFTKQAETVNNRLSALEKQIIGYKGFIGGIMFIVSALWTFFTWYKK